MSDDDKSSSTPSPPPAAEDTFKPTWKLPDGVEDHLTMGIIHAAVGVTVGGLAGLVLFKSGKGSRAMSMAAGLGVALGSTYERAVTSKTPSD